MHSGLKLSLRVRRILLADERTTVAHTSAHRMKRRSGLVFTALACSLALTAAATFAPLPALASTDDDVAATAKRVEEANDAYDAAVKKLDDIQGQIDDNQARVDQIEEQLPGQRQKSADSIRALYKMHQSSDGLINLVLSSEDFGSVISTMQYLNAISDRNNEEIEQLVSMENELNQTRATLEDEKAEAEQAKSDAEEALKEARAARAEAQQRAADEAAAEAKEREEALKAAKEAAAKKETFTTASGNTATVEVSDAKVGEAVVEQKEPAQTQQTPEVSEQPAQTNEAEPAQQEQEDSSNSVDAWAARIDAYLAGSPLAGQGRTFAEAALRYGVDPRWSPAIACIESGKGAHCFKSHNAWGWGNKGYASWEQAINTHVAGLASGYGYSITDRAAKKYCPPNWSFWYSSVSSEMSKI